jgi:hypothetical protein
MTEQVNERLLTLREFIEKFPQYADSSIMLKVGGDGNLSISTFRLPVIPIVIFSIFVFLVGFAIGKIL